ncbi:GTP-binding protein [Corticibacter populi]|uniref:GTP-binding protein n=1 Tax=Corticibacter populi TaxID=1550736 RepID=A0A3M6QYZ9_9BURK|nr:GTP-binding protein [Corticibacter populi]RMX08237.1 GTP-binding protein [Corticibacter populi]RZS35510.1 G3E family GTPase [Corticibacter populi]
MTPKSSLIPVTLLTGFLGSGKTTVLSHLVRQPELADALVIINEFGEMALDHLLVAHSTENLVMEMSSGCLCCTIRGDLVQTLRDITWRFSRGGQRQFRRVLIETTGLADPAPIIHTLMTHPQIAPKYRLDGIVTTVDLAAGMHTLDSHPEAVKQAAMADALLLTKDDLATDAQRTALLRRLDGINPAAPRWTVSNGEIAPAKVLDLGLFSVQGKAPDVERWLREEAYAESAPHGHAHDGLDHHQGHHDHGDDDRHRHGHAHGHEHDGHDGHDHHDVNRHDDHIRAFCFAVDDPIPEEMLPAWLDVLMAFVGSNILRVKGILNVEGHEAPIVVHGVQHIFHPPVPLPAWPGEDRRSRLVFITRDVDREAIEATFQAFRQVLPQALERAA